MPDSKLYEILGLERAATEAEIKQAYRRLARQYHPDKNPEQKSDEMFKKINFAHSVLTDTRKRKIYDQYGLQGLKDGLGNGLFDEPGGTSEEQLDNVEEILIGLLSEVFRNMHLQITEVGVQEFARGATRCATAFQSRDYVTALTETFNLSMQIYKAWPSRQLPPQDHES